MSNKTWCPGCESYLSSITVALDNDEPCPNCGLPAATIREIQEVRNSRANAELQEAVTDLLVQVERLQAENGALRQALDQVRSAVARPEVASR